MVELMSIGSLSTTFYICNLCHSDKLLLTEVIPGQCRGSEYLANIWQMLLQS